MSTQLHIVYPHCHTTNRLLPERLESAPNCGRCKSPLFSGQVLALDASSLDRHLDHSDLPLIVDFWAPWCGPCQTMAPAFAKAASLLEPRARLIKINTEEAPTLAARFAIRSIPTLAIYMKGREIARQSGAMDASSLMRWVLSHLDREHSRKN